MKSINQIKIDNVKFCSADPASVARGLIGYVSCRLNGSLQLDGLQLRRTADGRPTLSFPSRRDGMGRKHWYYKPLSNRAGRDIEAQVFRALGMAEGAASMNAQRLCWRLKW